MNDLARAAWSDLLFLANLILKWQTEMITDTCVDLDVEGCDFVNSETLDIHMWEFWLQNIGHRHVFMLMDVVVDI